VAQPRGKGSRPKELGELWRGLAGSGNGQTRPRLKAGARGPADLVAMGLSPHDATETVGAAVNRGLSQHDIERLRERLGQELKRGGSADTGAKRLREAIRSERPDDRSDRGPDRGPDKPEKPEKSEKMEKPEKPTKIENPGR